MTRREFLFAAPACAGLSGCLGLDPRLIVPPVVAAAVAESNTEFGFDLYDQLRQRPGNVLVSPFVASTLLNLAAAGAHGDTLDEFKRVLHRPAADPLNPAACSALQLQIAAGLARSGCELRAASGAWLQRGLPIQKEFEAIAQRNFGGALQSVDFNQTDAAVRSMNYWVESQTAFKVKNLIKPDFIDAQSRLVLAGAIHFKGVWSAPFPKGQTAYGSFQLADGSKSTVSFMRQSATHRYAEGDDWQAAEIGYSGAALSMLVVVPRTADGLPALEADIAADRLRKFRAPMEAKPIVVSLPRLKLSSDTVLDESLKALGLVRAFQKGEADFSKLTVESLALSAVIHRAAIEVVEDGGEMVQPAADPARTPGQRKSDADVKVLAADRPFLLAIRDRTSGSDLFLGRVVQP